VTSDTTGRDGDTMGRDGDTTERNTDTTSSGDETDRGRPCPQCGAAMVHRHCEYVCPNHGVVMDCSDTFYR
jgi:predicted RNA-binding Zn-ribbon protein involved in translation (DUF1610 family)